MRIHSADCDRWREAIRAWVGESSAGEQGDQVQRHIAGCPGCRRYAEELRAATAGLRWLATRPAEPSPGFRTRWTRAVEDAAGPSSLGETAAALLSWWRALLRRNLRPALGVASLWILALLFRLSAPDVSPSTHTTTARSPVEIYRVLAVHEQLLAGQLGRQLPVPGTPRKPHLTQPRGEGLPASLTAQWDPEPGVDAAVCELSPNPITHENLSTLPAV